MSSAPPRRDRLSGVTLGVVIGLVVSAVLAVCAIPAFGFYVWAFLGPDVDDAKAVAGLYLHRIEAGDDAGAYELLCADAREDVTLAGFTALVDEGPRPAGHAVTGASFSTEAGHSATVTVRLTARTGAVRELGLDLEQRAKGPWQVCGDPLI